MSPAWIQTDKNTRLIKHDLQVLNTSWTSMFNTQCLGEDILDNEFHFSCVSLLSLQD